MIALHMHEHHFPAPARLPTHTKSQYTDYVIRAEAIVSEVKDPELRKVAFQRILEDLLGSRPQRTLSPKSHDLKHRHTKPHIPRKISLLKK